MKNVKLLIVEIMSFSNSSKMVKKNTKFCNIIETDSSNRDNSMKSCYSDLVFMHLKKHPELM